MKQLIIFDGADSLPYTTPKDIDGEQLRNLKEYHVRPIGTEETKTIAHDDIKLFWLVDKTTGYIEGWVNPATGNTPFKPTKASDQLLLDIKRITNGVIVDKPEHQKIDITLTLDMQKHLQTLGIEIGASQLFDMLVNEGFIYSDGSATKWAIDNGYINLYGGYSIAGDML